MSATETQGNSYYWGQDLDGEPDTLWGLEGYTHAVGFFLGHPSSDIFKTCMAMVDGENLLKHEQGLASRDYDLYHYDFAGGWLKRDDDKERDSKTSYVVVHHFWAKEGKRDELIHGLSVLAEETKEAQGTYGVVQSCGVLQEVRDVTMATLWLRCVPPGDLGTSMQVTDHDYRTKTETDFKTYQSSNLYRKAVTEDLKEGGAVVAKTELHHAQNFNGHIDAAPISA